MKLNITSYEFAQNPYEYYKKLREKGQVHYLPDNNLWLIIGYQEAIDCLSNTEIFSSENEYCFDPILLNCDPPVHTQHRKPLSGTNGIFTAPRISSIEIENRAIFNTLLQPLHKCNSFDIITDLAMPFSTLVILNLLGINEKSIEELNYWSKNAVLNKSIYDNDFESNAWNNLKPKIKQWITHIEAKNGSFGIGEILHHKEASYLNNDKLLDLIKVLLIGGNETTPNLISSAMHIILKNPNLYTRLNENLALVPDFIYEVLRLEAPTQLVQRTTKKEVIIGEKVIPKGASISIAIGAANRDPLQFSNPDTFDLDRIKKKILSFGFGPHYCLGAHLAKQEAEIAIECILTFFPILNLGDNFKPKYKHSSHIRALETLPVYVKTAQQVIMNAKKIASNLLFQSIEKFNHFPSYENYPNIDEKNWLYTSPSPFIHANVMYSLQHTEGNGFSDLLIKGNNFLLKQKELNDTWRFWKVDECRNPVPPDIDDISICSKVIENSGFKVNNKSLLYHNMLADGTLYTWVIPDMPMLFKFPKLTLNYLLNRHKTNTPIKSKMLHKKDFELGVMVNALLYLGHNERTKKTVKKCIHIWKSKSDKHFFYDNNLIIAFLLARAYKGGIKEFKEIEEDIIAFVKNKAREDSLCEMILIHLIGKYFKNKALENKSKEAIIILLMTEPIVFKPYKFFTSKDRNYYGGSDCLTAAWFIEATQDW